MKKGHSQENVKKNNANVALSLVLPASNSLSFHIVSHRFFCSNVKEWYHIYSTDMHHATQYV